MNKLKLSTFKIIIVVVLIGLGGLVYWAYDVAPAKNDSSAVKFITYENNTIKEDVNGKLLWEFTVGKMTVDPTTKKATIEKVKGTFYGDDGRKLFLEADSGEYDENTHGIKFTKGLKLTSSDNQSFTSKELVWDNNERLLKALGDVVIKKPGLTAKADEAISSDNFKDFKLKGNARIIKGDQGNEIK